MKLSVLVALRDDSELQFRTRSWTYLRGLFERYFPEAELCVGTDDGIDPFHKTLALNRAAEMATGDVFYLTDVDTWVPSGHVRRCLDEMGNTWGRPWLRKLKLGPRDTLEVMENPTWDGEFTREQLSFERRENLNSYWPAPPLIVMRDHWFAVGGQDERFCGWGQEDTAFSYALRAVVGLPYRIDGYAIHLWHPRLGRSGRDRWSENDNGDNTRLVAAYAKALHNREQMLEVIAGRNRARHQVASSGVPSG